MKNPEKLISYLLDKELQERLIALDIERKMGASKKSLADYEEDVANIEEAIEMFKVMLIS